MTVQGSARLLATRAFVTLGVQLPLAAALILTRHGLLFLGTFFIPLLNQVPCRSRVTAEGLCIRWLCCEHLIPIETLATCSVGPDPRRWVVGRREPALTLTRRHSSKLILFGKLAELEALGAALERRLTCSKR